MAPPKPSVQTQFILAKMDDRFQQEDERWTQVNENFDLLFARVASIGINQERLESQMNLGNQVMEQMRKRTSRSSPSRSS